MAQTRLLLNRPSFARSLKDRPEDPSRSKVGASFLALYESAQEIVQLVKQLVIYHPSLIARWYVHEVRIELMIGGSSGSMLIPPLSACELFVE